MKEKATSIKEIIIFDSYMGCICFSFALVLFLLMWTKGYYDSVSYFHVAYTKLMLHGEHIPFRWLPYTIYSDHFIDHHYLWHKLLLPFYFIFDEIGFKISIALFCSFFLYYWLKVLNLFVEGKKLLPILLLLLSSPVFINRICMMRVQSASLLFLFAGLYFFFKERKVLCALIAFFYPWLYTGFMILPLILLSSVFSLNIKLINPRFKFWFLYIFIPSVVGLVVNPTFPENVYFIKFYYFLQVLENPTINTNLEYAPYSFPEMFYVSPVGILGVFYCFYKFIDYNNMKNHESVFYVSNIVLFFLSMEHRRFIEYYHPISVISVFIMFRDISSYENGAFKKDISFLLILISLLCIPFSFRVLAIHANKENKVNSQKILASEFLNKKSDIGDIVFNATWSDFDYLYYSNQKSKYVAGLDTKYLFLKDKYLYAVYVDPTKSKYYNDEDGLSAVLINEFNAKFIVLSMNNPSSKHYYHLIELDYNDFNRIYENEFVIIYVLNN